METSSPLAAMHRPAPAFGQRDLFTSHAHVRLPESRPSPGVFNLRDRFEAVQRNSDYFNVKSVRGSSPTASLAADLSQNFRLDNDMSPQFPTPRRALFTSGLMTAMEGRGFVTTPPLPPSSSPGPMNEMMDISPLPHKTPFLVQVEISSPTPIQSPHGDLMLEDSSAPLPRQQALEPAKPILAERRKLGLRRPSLNRSKGYSTGAIANRPSSAETQLPVFHFGGGCASNRASIGNSSLSLTECFQDSPPQERRPQTANSPSANAAGGPARPRLQFASLSNAGANRHNSPIPHSRRPANPFMRPRKQFRRSLSMFENPGEIVKPKEDTCSATALKSVMDIEEPHEPVLPHFFPEGESDSIPRIARSTFLEVLDGRFSEHYDQKMIIDCRFEYEYEGGHINGAINYNDKDLLATHLFRTPMEGRVLLIFHCEYSAHRAPIMARHIRAEDRTANVEFYPKLTYPEVYILEGGYSGFFADHRERCYPQAYVEMDAAEHAFTCEREMGRLRQNRKGLNRAQTFAFGQKGRSVSVDDSPTAPGRADSHGSPGAMMGASPILGGDRGHARRMASY